MSSRAIVPMAALTTSPGDPNPEGDNLSCWGSVENPPTAAPAVVSVSFTAPPRHRRMSAPSRPVSTGRGASTGDRSARDGPFPSLPTAAVVARRRAAANGGGGDGREGSSGTDLRRGAVRSKSASRGATVNITTRATAVWDERPPWNQSFAAKPGKDRQPASGKARGRDDYPSPAGAVNKQKTKRLSAGSAGCLGRRAGVDPATTRTSDNTDEGGSDESELDAAAPSQQDIRRMIERIRREADREDPKSVEVGTNGERRAPAEGDGATAPTAAGSRGRHPFTGGAGSASKGSKARPPPPPPAAGADSGVVGIGEIEKEERRLNEKASKLELEMSAVQRRRVEVHLVKVEQQLEDEAASRLMLREKRLRTEMERACKALREERDDRVCKVAAAKENLREKLEQLSSMYEEVSKRLEELKMAYTNAEDELRERASVDQRKAEQREEQGVRRRIRAMMIEQSKNALDDGVEIGERSSARSEETPSTIEAEQPPKLQPQVQKRQQSQQQQQQQRVTGRSREGTPVKGAAKVKRSGSRDRRRLSAGSVDSADAPVGVGLGRGVSAVRRRRASVELRR